VRMLGLRSWGSTWPCSSSSFSLYLSCGSNVLSNLSSVSCLDSASSWVVSPSKQPRWRLGGWMKCVQGGWNMKMWRCAKLAKESSRKNVIASCHSQDNTCCCV
jgi:hypothetical protein